MSIHAFAETHCCEGLVIVFPNYLVSLFVDLIFVCVGENHSIECGVFRINKMPSMFFFLSLQNITCQLRLINLESCFNYICALSQELLFSIESKLIVFLILFQKGTCFLRSPERFSVGSLLVIQYIL